MELLLEKDLHLTPADACSHIILPFAVPHDFQRLEIRFFYSPKYIEDPQDVAEAVKDCWQKYLLPEDIPEEVHPEDYHLSNLLTLSLDVNGRYIGAAHRQSSDQLHIISAESSSPGFWRCPIEKGMWRAVISIHALAAGTVDCHITAVGKEEGE